TAREVRRVQDPRLEFTRGWRRRLARLLTLELGLPGRRLLGIVALHEPPGGPVEKPLDRPVSDGRLESQQRRSASKRQKFRPRSRAVRLGPPRAARIRRTVAASALGLVRLHRLAVLPRQR